MKPLPFALAVGVFCAALTRGEAQAYADKADESYGRIDGDLTIAAGPFAAFGARAPRFGVDLLLRYASTAGMYGSFEDALGSNDPIPRRVFAGGFEIRPLFLARWLTEREFGKRRLDLTVDSLALSVGTFVAHDKEFLAPPGLEARVEISTPFFASPEGPWLAARVTGRWSHDTLSGSSPQTPQDRALMVSVIVRWEQLVNGVFRR